MTGRLAGYTPATCEVCGSILAAGSGACAVCGTPAPASASPPRVDAPREDAPPTRAPVVIRTPAVASLRLGHVPASIEVGAQLFIGATPLDEGGHPVHRPVSWRSSDAATASVSAAGAVSAHAPGTVVLTCASDGRAASVELTVVPVRVAAIRLDPPPEVRVGEPFVLDAEALSAHGRPVPALLEFTSTAPDVAAVDDRGVVTPLAPGEVTVVARAGGAQGMTTMAVVPAHRRRPRPRRRRRDLERSALAALITLGVGGLAVVVSLAGGRDEATSAGDVERAAAAPAATAPLPPRPRVVGAPPVIAPGDTFTVGAPGLRAARWHSSDEAVLAVDSLTGLARALRSGAAELLAVSGADSLRLPVTVGPATRLVARVARDDSAMTVGETRRLRLRVLSPPGAAAPTVTWTSSAPAVLEVDPRSGVATARAEGTASVVAAWEGGADSVAVTVAGVPVARVELERTSLSLTVGESTRVRAAALDASGAPIPGRSVEWRSGDPDAVSVTSEGVVRARAAGTVPLVARAGDESATLRVRVRESVAAGARRLDARADELAAAVLARDAERVRRLVAAGDPGLRPLLDLLARREVRLRDLGRDDRTVTDSAGAVTVRVEAVTPRFLRDHRETIALRVRLRLADGSWQPLPAVTASP